MTLGLFSVIAVNVTDTFYIGKLGGTELAAVGFCFPIIFGLSAISIGMANGGASIVSRAIGAGRDTQARELISSALLFVFLVAVVLTLIMFQISDQAFLLLGAPPELLPTINQFMHIWYLGLPLLVAPIVLNGLIRAAGEAKVPSGLMVLAAVINAVISPFLIFGLLGMPELGMRGAAIATIIARFVISAMAVHWLLRSGLLMLSGQAFQRFIPCTAQVLKYGAPAFFAQLSSPIAMATVTKLLSAAGPATVAGFAVGARIEALALIPFFALQTGITPFIGQNVGGEADGRLRQSERAVWFFCALWGGISGLILFTCGESLAALFTDTAAISATSDAYLEAISFGMWGAGLVAVAIGIFSPLGYPNLSMAANALRYVVFYAGGAFLAVSVFGIGAEQAVFWSSAGSYAVAGIIAAFGVRVLLTRPNRKDLVVTTTSQPSVARSSR